LFPPHIIDDIAGYFTLGASVGGAVGSYLDHPAFGLAIGGQLGVLAALLEHIIRGDT